MLNTGLGDLGAKVVRGTLTLDPGPVCCPDAGAKDLGSQFISRQINLWSPFSVLVCLESK